MPNGDESHENFSRQLDSLITHPHEDLDVEIKGWIDLQDNVYRAKLAKEIIALANHGGGFVLFGFLEEDGTWVSDLPRPENLDGYSQDLINGIVQRYVEPRFHCNMYQVVHPNLQEMFPVLVVPGNHSIPIRSTRSGPNGQHLSEHTYYIRRLGPASESPQSGAEWDALIGRCVRANENRLVDLIRQVLRSSQPDRAETTVEQDRLAIGQLVDAAETRFQHLVSSELPDEQSSLYSHGTWIVAYVLDGDLEVPALEELKRILRDIPGTTGWPPWWVPTRPEIRPYVQDGQIECWMRDVRAGDPAHADFWRASPDSGLFLVRGYQEDSHPDQLEPGSSLDFILPIWRVGECLLHAQALAAALGDPASTVNMRFSWRGLNGRELVSWNSRGRDIRKGRISRQNVVTACISVQADTISATLPEVVHRATVPLYEVFDFFRVGTGLVSEELRRMLGGN